jgi:predicted GNAT family N-acyltransferase
MGQGRGAALPDGLIPLGMNEIEIIEVRSGAQLEQALAIRLAVFVEEQGVSRALEIDGRDGEARHLLALQDAVPVGTLRLRRGEDGRVAKIERVAVLPAARGAKVGQALVAAALSLARAADAETAMLHAQTTVQEFYARLGFVAFGPEFIEDSIPHVAMRLPLCEHMGQRDGLA